MLKLWKKDTKKGVPEVEMEIDTTVVEVTKTKEKVDNIESEFPHTVKAKAESTGDSTPKPK